MSQTKKETYFTQLDGIRFVAVALVLFDHWLAEKNVLPLGHLGVTMFFVLSGFLITRILIESKLKDDKIGRSHWFSVKQFIIRRSIRIFPIYFLAIFALYIFDVPPVRDTVFWCLGYATNFYIAIHQHWMGTIDHLWSLAVEEQYYLIFPYLILFLPKKHYLKVLVGMVLLSISLRIFFYLQGSNWVIQYVLMPTCLDCFGLGGLMAYYFTFHKEAIFEKLANTWLVLLSFGVYAFSVYYTLHQQSITHLSHQFGTVVLERFVSALFCFFFIAKAVSGYQNFGKSFLENPVVSYFGRISYGIYLYHNFIYNYYHTPQTSIILRVLHKIQRIIPAVSSNVSFELFYYFIITIVVASLSWFLVEKPINHLKKYFTY